MARLLFPILWPNMPPVCLTIYLAQPNVPAMRQTVRFIILVISITLLWAAILAQWRGISVHFGQLTVGIHASDVDAAWWPDPRWGYDFTDETVNRYAYWHWPNVGTAGHIHYLSFPWVCIGLVWISIAVPLWLRFRRKLPNGPAFPVISKPS